MDVDKMQKMKYGDLQKLAKESGIKANMKGDKLLEALVEYFNKQSDSSNEVKQSDCSQYGELDEENVSPEIVIKMVTIGRGGKKRKKSVLPEPDLPKITKKSRISVIDGAARSSLVGDQLPLPNRKKRNNKFFPNIAETPIKRQIQRVKTESKSEVKSPIKKENGSDVSEEPRKTRSRHPTFNKNESDFLHSPDVIVPTVDLEHNDSTGNLQTSLSKLSKNRRSDASKVLLSPVRNKSLSQNRCTPHIEISKENTPSLSNSKPISGECKSTVEKSHIPRFISFLEQKAIHDKKNNRTPNWEKIHKRNFDKMESIDEYILKKRKNTQTLSHTIKSAIQVVQDVRSVIDNLKANQKQDRKRSSVGAVKTPRQIASFVPAITFTKKLNSNTTQNSKQSSFLIPQQELKNRFSLSAAKTPRQAAPFVPTVTSTKHLDLNFNSAQNKRKSITDECKNIIISTKTTTNNLNTVFQFNANSAASPKKKNVFDLHASLQKKFNYKPYTGKLKPLNSPDVRLYNHSHIKIKEPVRKNKNSRRQALQFSRETTKANNQMTRRGLNAVINT